jgi:hypothetical protein
LITWWWAVGVAVLRGLLVAVVVVPVKLLAMSFKLTKLSFSLLELML